MFDPLSHVNVNDVTNTHNYLLVNKGANELIDTISCASGLAGDDRKIGINSVSYDQATFTSTLYLPTAMRTGSYRLFACGTTSLTDLQGNILAGDGSNPETDYAFDFAVEIPPAALGEPSRLPVTGFPMDSASILPIEKQKIGNSSSDLMLVIPSLGLHAPIVGVPRSGDSWDVTWLADQAGYLYGSIYPTWEGNTVLTGHVWNADNSPGIFANLKSLKSGDQFEIRAFGQNFTYEVRETLTVSPSEIFIVFSKEEHDWVTLVTCESYDPSTRTYGLRRVVRGAIVKVEFSQMSSSPFIYSRF